MVRWDSARYCTHSCYWKDKEGKSSWNKGKKLSPEHINKLKQSHKGKPSHWKNKKRPETVGENNPNWKGGITPINAKIRTSFEYKIWRRTVFERDNYTCVWCSARNGEGKTIILHADHIKPFAYFPELRLAVDNGRTLCIQCHKTTDSYLKQSLNTNV